MENKTAESVQKKSYSSPELTRYGDIRQITLTSNGNQSDNPNACNNAPEIPGEPAASCS